MSDAGLPTYSVEVIAKLFMLSVRRVQQLAQAKIIPKTERGRYELAPAVQAYIRYLQDRSIGSGGKGSPADYHSEKSRLVKFQADKAELEVTVRKGELAEVSDVSEQWAKQVIGCKTRLLGIGSKAAPMVMAAKNAGEAQAIIDDMVREALLELAENYELPESKDNLNNVTLESTTETEGE